MSEPHEHPDGCRPPARLSHDRGADADLRAAAVQLRAAAVKAGAHIVVTTDYPDGVKAFGILCDAIDVMDNALEALSVPAPTLPALDVNGLADRLVAAGKPTDLLTAAGWRIVLPRMLDIIREALRDAV